MGRMIKSEKPHKRLVCVAFRDIWQGQKDSNPRHVVLELWLVCFVLFSTVWQIAKKHAK